jgi:hypothetical protein
MIGKKKKLQVSEVGDCNSFVLGHELLDRWIAMAV